MFKSLTQMEQPSTAPPCFQQRRCFYLKWDPEQERFLVELLKQHGRKYHAIAEEFSAEFSPVDIKRKCDKMLKQFQAEL